MSDVAHKKDFNALLLAQTESEAPSRPLVVKFSAPWCAPCKAYAPIFDRVAEANEGADFLTIDTEEDPALSQRLGVRGLPTTQVWVDGELRAQRVGLLMSADLSRLLSEACEA